ncbi:HAMP domain-containing sensor histidine kinase [Streptomyces pathocidini]|uniref:sensor histidine kinase n=1 Tax=Streptomyces pathocidini TaxID=1650571 RepID=UPI0033D3C401
MPYRLAPLARALVRAADPRSLRWKIAALVAAATCAVAAAIGVLVHQATWDSSLSHSEGIALRDLASAVTEHADRRGGDAQDSPVVGYSVYDPASLPDPLQHRLGASREAVTWYDDRQPDLPWMWAAQRDGKDVLAVQISMTGELYSLEALDRHMTEAALLALAVVIPLSALATELLNRRLRRVAGTARRIRDGDLDARTGTGGHDEIAEISAAVDLMADSLRERLRTEQRFTADVAHELRTPLMGLVTSAGLLPDGEATDLVRDRVRVLRALVEDLLEISRLDAGAERADLVDIPLGPLVEDCLRRAGLEARLTVAGEPTAHTDPRRLDRIVTNLVVNAHRHGRPPVEVSVGVCDGGATIAVRDHGPGFPEDLLAHGPQRFRTGAAERGGGHGLGLTIAQGQAAVIGAGLHFSNPESGGAVATLHLPLPGADGAPTRG